MRKLISTIVVLTTIMSWAQSFSFTKELIFPAETDSAEKIRMAAHVVPLPRQLAWQKLEMTAFIHFGVNTFTDREWGNGRESPTVFNPDSLDADQWISTLKNAGFKMAILTAKHHDGFCLWPTATTPHSVAASPWQDGKGDVMREFSEACRRHDMKIGFYLSPWDRNAPCYGDSAAYNDMYVAQLTELLTNYGKIDEIWFDSACGEGPNGRKQVYDLKRYKDTANRLQPDAVLAIMGDDVRWVGNEKGYGRQTEWSVTPLTPGVYPDAAESNSALGLVPKSPDLGSRDLVAKAQRLFWWPSEVDVSIRPGWFWHENESPKTLPELTDIYLNSVGRNSVLLLNVPPNTHGKIASADSTRLMELREWIDTNFAENIYNRPDTTVNCVVLQEDITKGQRVERFAVKTLAGDTPQTIAEGTTIGYKRIVMFEPVPADSIRIEILESRDTPCLLPVQAFNISVPQTEATPGQERMPDALEP